MHLELPGRDDRRQVVAEDAQVLAYRGRADDAEWLAPADVQALLAAQPSGNVPPDQAIDFAERAVADLPALRPHLDERRRRPGQPAARGPHPRPRGGRPARPAADRRPRPETRRRPRRLRLPARPGRWRVMTAFGSREDRRRAAARRPARPGVRRRPAGARDRPGDLRAGARRVGTAAGLPVLAVPAGGLAGLQAPRRRAGDEPRAADARSARVTRERWLRILLRELGFHQVAAEGSFELDGKSFPVSHRSGHVPDPPARLGAPTWTTRRRTSPPAPRSRWSRNCSTATTPTCGRSCPTARRCGCCATRPRWSAPSYVEFDLEAIFDGELFSDFVLLYLVCHESRFAIHGDGGPAVLLPGAVARLRGRAGRARARPATRRRPAGHLDPRHRVPVPSGQPAAPQPARPAQRRPEAG